MRTAARLDGRDLAMRATIGDSLTMHGRVVGDHDVTAEVLEVRGQDGSPPYWVRFDDGHEALVFPGPDATVHPSDS